MSRGYRPNFMISSVPVYYLVPTQYSPIEL